MREQNEVGGVHDERDLNVVVRDVAFIAGLFHLVGPDVDSGAHDHLGKLGSGDEHCDVAGDAEFQGLKSIVAVHNAVHEVVHAHEPTSGRDVVRVRVPGVQEHGHVVVPVEEDEGLFSEDDEDGVTKLRDLAQGEHPVPEPAHSVVQETCTRDAYGIFEGESVKHIEELWNGSGGAPYRKHC